MSHNTLLHRLVRPAARRLAPTRLRPNHLTALRIATALAAAAAFARGTSEAVWAGGGLFTVSALLDRADGELARLTGQFSRLGHRLDLIGDAGSNVVVFLAMGIGARRGRLRGHGPVLGVLAAASTAALFQQLNRPTGAPRQPARRRLLDPDDAALGIPILACCMGLPTVLLLASSITPLVVAGLAVSRLGGSGSQTARLRRCSGGT